MINYSINNLQSSFVNIRTASHFNRGNNARTPCKKSWGKEGGQERILGWIIGDVYFHRWSNGDKNSSIYVPPFLLFPFISPSFNPFRVTHFSCGERYTFFPPSPPPIKQPRFVCFESPWKECNFYCIVQILNVLTYRL